ncbi:MULTISPECIES: trans-aconitate 2-methyltransferase [unclassified Streptomyces]|uniref:trans-aconitate 2-methyltransferase n=1 Tax=unclassified Streptomyces TaxID=2593676 RepID=UPI002254B83D|nr:MULTISPECIES: trans-aconitate 2-methyltransferase [unclassified Streptomyces]MCX4550448.1 trans-aconitate 2-methyltransferase [Streptomyces sp. NBC_01500]WSC21902.1 trans-aconitate 2-methyltransferase [Streptomyces sp. NBC_01766]
MTPPTWDPQQYLRHADHRTRPFHDLLSRITGTPTRIADLGCGAGNVTALLSERWPEARVTGFDNSPQMLEQAQRYAGPRLTFRPADAATWTPTVPYDLLVSNALLQWVPGHADRFPDWLDALAPGGTFAFQVPGNFTAPSHTILADLRESARWKPRLGGVGDRTAAVLAPGQYLTRLTDLGCAADVWETTYLQLLTGDDPVLDWVKGTALRPVLTALADDPEATGAFLTEYRDLLRAAYPPGPHGTVFPFRRIFAVARKKS